MVVELCFYYGRGLKECAASNVDCPLAPAHCYRPPYHSSYLTILIHPGLWDALSFKTAHVPPKWGVKWRSLLRNHSKKAVYEISSYELAQGSTNEPNGQNSTAIHIKKLRDTSSCMRYFIRQGLNILNRTWPEGFPGDKVVWLTSACFIEIGGLRLLGVALW